MNADRALQMVMGSLIQAKTVTSALGQPREQWEPGKPLKLLLAGYVGNRNTGADVRVEEMIRQFRHIFGDPNLRLSILTLDPELTSGYFEEAKQITLPKIFPGFLYRECPKHHGVVACEGSMFKSKFADALSTMMAGALGIANAEGKLSVGYGAEAGNMTPHLQSFVKKHCQDSLILCRNQASQKILQDLGIRTSSGTDTAWTFEPSSASKVIPGLKKEGWDGEKKILMVCPINPFWWPVKPSLMKSASRWLGNPYKETHYTSIYFHEYSEKAQTKFSQYIQSLAHAINAFTKEHPLQVFLVAMERLDVKACEKLQEKLARPAPILSSQKYNMFDLVGMLRQATLLLSSRFHAIATSMPGQVASAGITMDERIRNLLIDRGHPNLLLEVDDPHLGDRALEVLRFLHQNQEAISNEIGRSIPKQLELMGNMGMRMVDEVQQVYPEFPRKLLPLTWESHLPPLSQTLQTLMEKFA